MTKLYSILFGSILVIGFLTRFLFLDKYPLSLNWDEISHGYNAYSILLTGKDQWGVKLPVFNFRAYGDYPTTLNLYFTIPFIKLLGLNPASIRLPSAIFGFIFIPLMFFFAKLVLKSTPLSLFCMFLAAISPWSLFPSRAVFQSNFSQTLLLAGICFFLYGIKKPKYFYLSSLFFGLSMYSYHNARIITPILVPFLIISHFQDLRKIFSKNKLPIFFSLCIILFLAVPNLFNLFSSESTARNRWVGIINPNSVNLINENRRLFDGPKIFNLLVNNKAVYFTQTFIVNYLNLFNPIPIFFRGSQNYQFNPPNTGLLFIIFLPFLYIGLLKTYFSYKNRSVYLKWFFILLILLFPAAITVGDFPSIRATSALPLYYIFIAIGFGQLNIKKYKVFQLLILFIAVLEFFNYSKKYFSYTKNYAYVWQYGYSQAVEYTRKNYDQYSHIYFTKKYGEPHEFVLFYCPWDPSKYQSDPNLKWDFHADWYWVDGFDKFTFLNDWDIPTQNFQPNSLLITSPGNFPKNNKFSQKQSVKFPDGTTAFDIISYD